MNRFYWDPEACEVRDSERTMWLRRIGRIDVPPEYDRPSSKPEGYVIFAADYSVGFAADHRIEDATGWVEEPKGLWFRNAKGYAITQIRDLTCYGVCTVPRCENWRDFGPFQPAFRTFDTFERQHSFLMALPAMLAVLPESHDFPPGNRTESDGRVGYETHFSKTFLRKLEQGRFLS